MIFDIIIIYKEIISGPQLGNISDKWVKNSIYTQLNCLISTLLRISIGDNSCLAVFNH